MQNIAPDPARCTTRHTPSPTLDAIHASVRTDGISIHGDGSYDKPYTVNADNTLKTVMAHLGTTPKVHFMLRFQADTNFIIPSRYRQIMHTGRQSIFTAPKDGYYYFSMRTSFSNVMDATRLAGTIWRNDNRTDSGASGSLGSKEVPATEPFQLSCICPLNQGDDVWCTLWHDATQPLFPKEFEFLVLAAFEQDLEAK